MVLDAFANFVRGTVNESIDNSQTTITVTDASIFPDPSVQGEFNVVIWDVNNFPRPDQDIDVEILRVTGIDTGTDTLTVARGQEMTAAAAHPSGSAVHLSPTAKMFSDIEDTFADFWDASAQELTGDVNNSVVNTERAYIAGTSVGATKQMLRAETNSERGGAASTQPTDSVGTSAKTIWSSEGDGDRATAIVTVLGSDTGSVAEFYDIVQYGRATSPTVIASDRVATPASRSYSRGGGGTLQLAMGSSTYNIVSTAIESIQPTQ